eukprot:4181939-Pyramimonas_sp.AAC.1
MIIPAKQPNSPVHEHFRWPGSALGARTQGRQVKGSPGMEVWELDEHEVSYSWLRAFKMYPGNGVLGTTWPGNG